MYLKNYYSNAENSFFDQKEVEVLPAILINVASNVLQRDDKEIAGSCLINGRKNDSDESETMIEFDFEKGTDVGVRYAGLSSRCIVEHVATNSISKRKLSGYIASFRDDKVDEEILFFHTNKGVLTCSICMNYPYVEVELYMAIAKAISMMNPDDQKAQKSYRQLIDEEGKTSPTVWLVDNYINDLFKKTCHIPQLQEWKKWHAKQRKKK